MGRGKFAGTTRRSGNRPKWTGKLALAHDSLDIPHSGSRDRRVFVNSMSDLFHESVPLTFIHKVFAVIEDTPRHTYQVLTKRADRLAELAPRLG